MIVCTSRNFLQPHNKSQKAKLETSKIHLFPLCLCCKQIRSTYNHSKFCLLGFKTVFMSVVNGKQKNENIN